MNTPLLRRIQRAILARPDQFEMSGWFNKWLLFDSIAPIPAGGCGTAACIAGWAVVLNRNKTHKIKNGKVRKVCNDLKEGCRSVSSVATRALDITSYQRAHLFYLSAWPLSFRFDYDSAATPLARAKVAVARIDYFIKRGG